MSLKSELKTTAGLEDAWRAGLQSLLPSERPQIACTDPRLLSGSADIDSSLRASHANDPRWDYVVGYGRGPGEVAHFIEFHPASGASSIREVIAKAEWLLGWLRGTPLASRRRQLSWISTGYVGFPKIDSKAKSLAKHGVVFRGRRLVL